MSYYFDTYHNQIVKLINEKLEAVVVKQVSNGLEYYIDRYDASIRLVPFDYSSNTLVELLYG